MKNIFKIIIFITIYLVLLNCNVLYAIDNGSINSIEIEQEHLSIYINESTSISSNVYGSNGNSLSNGDITSLMVQGDIWWESSNPSVLKVVGTDVGNQKSKANVKGVTSGIATLYIMSSNGINSSCDVVVRNESAYETKEFNDIRGDFETMYFAGFSCLDLAPRNLNGLAVNPDLLIQQIAEAKITTIILNNNIGYPDVWNDTVMDILIKKFDEYDIKILVDDYRIRSLLSDLNDINNYHYNTLTDFDELKRLVNLYADYDNVLGFYIFDEPGTNGFDYLSAFARDINEITNNKKEVYINLYPNYASEAQLEGNGDKIPDSSMTTSENYYNNYLLKFVTGKNAVDTSILSFDHYSTYFTDNKDSLTNLYINLLNVLSASRLSKTDNIPMNYIIILEQTIGGVHYRNLNIDEIALQASINLALGMKRMGYYACITPRNGIAVPESALFDYNSNETSDSEVGARQSPVTEHYYMVSDINNKWLLQLGNELYDKELQHVYEMSSYGTFPQYNNQVDEHDKIGNITSNTNGILISTFSDNSFLIVNTNSDSSNTINFNDLSNYCYFDYDYNNWAKASNVSFKYSENNNNKNYLNINLSNNSITLAPGHCILMKNAIDAISLGDIDNDGTITIMDVRLLLQFYINSIGTPTQLELKQMDMNNDKNIDIMDVRLLLQQYINM